MRSLTPSLRLPLPLPPLWLPALRRRRPPPPPRQGHDHPRMVALMLVAPAVRANKLIEDIYAIRLSGEPGAVSINVTDIKAIKTTADRPANAPEDADGIRELYMRKLARRRLVRRLCATAAYALAGTGIQMFTDRPFALASAITTYALLGWLSFR